MALQIANSSKTYGNGVEALAGVSISVRNSLFDSVGRDGAGKSTLMRMIATLQDTDSGGIELNRLVLGRQDDGPRARRCWVLAKTSLNILAATYMMRWYLPQDLLDRQRPVWAILGSRQS